jgi:hypothetical protein
VGHDFPVQGSDDLDVLRKQLKTNRENATVSDLHINL